MVSKKRGAVKTYVVFFHLSESLKEYLIENKYQKERERGRGREGGGGGERGGKRHTNLRGQGRERCRIRCIRGRAVGCDGWR